MLQLEWPWVLLFLALPAVAYYLLPAISGDSEAALRVPFIADFKLAEATRAGGIPSKQMFWISLLAWTLLVFAASRPQWLGDTVSIHISGRDLMLAVDLSESMLEKDFQLEGDSVNRLVATQSVASQFIANRRGDRIGLILFGSRAYLQTPLTFDVKTVNQLLQESAIGLAGKFTAIGDAIGLAIKRLEKSDQQSKVLVLMTDGANTAGEVTPIKAAQLAADQKLKIYTIGIGADEMIRQTLFGQERVNPSAQLDEKTLRQIANLTGGRYFRARDSEEFAQIYGLIDKLEPLERDEQKFRPIRALFYWPLAASLILAMVIVLVRWRQRSA